jgi:hypothetical protein
LRLDVPVSHRHVGLVDAGVEVCRLHELVVQKLLRPSKLEGEGFSRVAIAWMRPPFFRFATILAIVIDLDAMTVPLSHSSCCALVLTFMP